ncbi:MAG: hypothetical protein LAP13_22465 [Acidobacteriia bacterium]|nr:hypothetical protein [Terriglobia bacterium]
MANPSLKLEYTPTSSDLSSYTARGRSYVPQGPFLAVAKPGYFVHGNSYTQVQKNGDDVSGSYSTWRRWRIWRLPPGEDFNAVGWRESNWEDDNLSKTPNWMDIPGCIIIQSPDTWKNERRMLEFVVSVDDHTTESGALYFSVMVSTRPGAYRVQMSSGKNIPFQKWAELAKTSAPWAKASECTIEVDSRWLQV